MTDDERRVSDMYKHVLAALPVEFADLPKNSEGDLAAKRLAARIPVIEQFSAEQAAHDGTAKQGTAQRGVARKSIKDFLKRTAKTAETIARKNPGFEKKFAMAYGKNDEQLLASAQASHTAAIENQTDFVNLGIKPEYLESIEIDINAFATALNVTNAATASRGAAVSGLDETFDSADDDFATLDTFIRNHYSDNLQKLAAWRIASHIERAPRKPKTPPQT